MGAVSAVVVNYNARAHLLACLRSLRAEGVDDVVVADNGSLDGSEAAVRAADGRVRWLPTGGNLGYGTAANRGAERTDRDTPYLLCMNPDATVEPGAVKALVDVLDARPEVGVVGPRIEEVDGSLYPSARRFPSLADSVGHAFLGMVWPANPFTRRYRMLDWDHEPADVDWVSGACFLVRRTLWERLGGFDEGYFMYAEDVDLCWRA
ncbi:MAG TPA: glycosyltransferase family 2 protein, partial [Acidimicrobiales bacterium]|nr:glycosyltransferase family 2 protein [Acidimicrobiales bacterium]